MEAYLKRRGLEIIQFLKGMASAGPVALVVGKSFEANDRVTAHRRPDDPLMSFLIVRKESVESPT